MISRRKFVCQSVGYASILAMSENNVGYILFKGINDKSAVFDIQILVEEDIYSYVNANNGAGPLWAGGCTVVVRSGDKLFVSGLMTDPDIKGLSNCQWLLFERKKYGWFMVSRDLVNYTREPCPLGVFNNNKILLSINPKMADSCIEYCPTLPGILVFDSEVPQQSYEHWIPEWGNNPGFNDHSYRAWGVDGRNNEVVLFQNYMYEHAEWCYRDKHGKWSATGAIEWPKANYDGQEVSLRLCYSNVVLENRKIWFLSTSDIVEPVKAWKEYKIELTGQKWDYVFRRLYFAWNEDVSEGEFSSWILIADREQTAGNIRNQDLFVDSDGVAYLLWVEQAIDIRLRDEFFPEAKQYRAVNCSVIKNGNLEKTIPIMSSREEKREDLTFGNARFQRTPDGRLFVIYYLNGTVGDGQRISENRIVEIKKGPDASCGSSMTIPLESPFVSFQMPSQGSGCNPSYYIDLLGVVEDKNNIISYAQIELAK